MNRRKLVFGTIILLGIILVLLVLIVFNNRTKEAGNIIVGDKNYDAASEIKEAKKNLNNSTEKSSIIGEINTSEKVAAITFEGMVDEDTTNRILELLDTYGMPAVFFLPGVKSAEDHETVKQIADSGQEIGSYTLSALKEMELLTNEELIDDFSKANVILKTITGEAPDLLKCNVTEYTEDLLKVSYACGLDSVVSGSHFLNYQSFAKEEDAAEYVIGLKKGSIISIKTDSVLEESEYDTAIRDEEETIAIDPEPGLEEGEESVDPNNKLIEVVKFLLKALSEENYNIVSVRELGTYDDADFLKDFSKERDANEGKLAEVLTRISTGSQYITFTFRDIENEKILNTILDLLKENQIKATFFVTGEEIINYPDRIQKIIKDGHTLGNGGMDKTSLVNGTFEEICFDIFECDKLLKEKFGVSTNFFMPIYGKYNDTIREAASALGYVVVTYSKNPIVDNSLDVEEIMKYYKNGFRNGDIIYFSLNYYENLNQVVENTYDKIKDGGREAVSLDTLYENRYSYMTGNKGSTSSEGSTVSGTTSQTGGTGNTDTISKTASKGSGVDTTQGNYQNMRSLNQGKQSEKVSSVYTTQGAVSYTFRGLGNTETVEAVLNTLDEINAKATFFVTGKEIIAYPDLIKKIVSRGHQVANGGYGMVTTSPRLLDFDSICYEIDMGERYLKAFLGSDYKESINKMYMPLYGDSDGNVLEAASALGYQQVITYNRSAMRDSYKNLTSDEIMKDYFANTIALQRGDIVYFRLDYLTKQNVTLELIKKIADNYVKNSTYDIVDLGNLTTSKLVYTPKTRQEATTADYIQKSKGYDKKTLNDKIMKHYIGNPDINSVNELIGFTLEEIAKVNTVGRIETNGEKVLFLTFDDWGSDASITPLLNILNRYNAKATFFIRVGTESTAYESEFLNPNLLRAIALAGHDIGNHTFKHMNVNITTQKEKEMLQNDAVIANNEMFRYISDTGALKNFFRPPTLAVSKLGLETIFDCGFEYIVNGDFSTHDYEAPSVNELIQKLINGINIADSSKPVTESTLPEDIRAIQSGSIIVMHMSDESKYTSEALDTVIPYYIKQGYRFARLSDYLKDGYQNLSLSTSP